MIKNPIYKGIYMSTKLNVLIGGGSGFIGRHLKSKLLARGHNVTIISRTSGKDRITWKQLETCKRWPDCDAVVNLSGENILQPGRRWTVEYQNAVRDSRIGTNEVLVKAIIESERKPKCFITSSAEAYYPRHIGADTYDENYITDNGTTWMQQLCIDWEASAHLPSELNIRSAIVRIGVVLSKDGGAVASSWWPFYFGVGGHVGSGEQGFPWIHIEDMIGIFVHALENDNVAGPLNGVAPALNTNHEFTKAFGRALGRPTIFPVPEFVLNFGFGSERAGILLGGARLIPKRTMESGFVYQFTDIDKAMNDVVNS